VSDSTTETTAEEALEEDLEAGPDAEPREAELDPETAARRKAALAQIRQFGDPGSTRRCARRSSRWAT
jgi:hypothetical protein